MAQAGVQLDEKTFSCSICLDLLKDPVTIPCGHSYCLDCIKAHLDGEDEKRLHSCPQCMLFFIPRPALAKNTMLASLVEELNKTGQQAADLCPAGPEDVACDVCTGEKLKAHKSCLICLASFCEKHLQPHHESPAFENHKLVEPSVTLKEKIQKRIQERENDMKVLQQEVEAINRSADKAVEDNEKVFTDLIRVLEKRRSDVKQLVRSQQETEVSRVKELQEKLQQEITELKRKDAELEQLSQTDSKESLHNYPSPSPLSKSIELPKIRPLKYFDDVTEAVSKAKVQVMFPLGKHWPNLPRTVVEVDVLLPQPEPKTRAEFLKYSHDFHVALYSWHPHVRLSDEQRKAEVIIVEPRILETIPETTYKLARTGWARLLGEWHLPGHSYWEVRWRGGGVHVGVACFDFRFRKNMDFSPHEFGMPEKSWVLLCDKQWYQYWYYNRKVRIPVRPSSRVGVYVDRREGSLSFYKICDFSDTMTILHRVKTTFPDRINAVTWISNCPGTTVEFSKFREAEVI